jgi:hypothetical protein
MHVCLYDVDASRAGACAQNVLGSDGLQCGSSLLVSNEGVLDTTIRPAGSVMASSTCSAGCSCLVLAASLLAFAVLSTDAQSTSSTAANNSGSNARPKCPVQGVNYCVCADHSCGGCPECAGCDDSQCVGVGPLKEITAARPKLSRAKAGRLQPLQSCNAILRAETRPCIWCACLCLCRCCCCYCCCCC